MTQNEPTSPTGGYTIGAAARLSGVSREKIRIWERRYDAVTPGRDATNHRVYSRQDVERLTLIRRLVDGGHAVSSVAGLSLPALKRRLAQTPGSAPQPPGLAGSAMVVSSEGPELARHLTSLGIGAVSHSVDGAELTDMAPDLLVVERPTVLGADLPELVALRRRAPHSPMLLVYRFAPGALLDQLRNMGVRPVKAPLQPDALRGYAIAGMATASADASVSTATPPPRRYSAAQLAETARVVTVHCECPRHLADLVRELNAFEDYSLNCEAQSPEDAALHGAVYRLVAQARSLVEDALGIVAREELLEP